MIHEFYSQYIRPDRSKYKKHDPGKIHPKFEPAKRSNAQIVRSQIQARIDLRQVFERPADYTYDSDIPTWTEDTLETRNVPNYDMVDMHNDRIKAEKAISKIRKDLSAKENENKDKEAAERYAKANGLILARPKPKKPREDLLGQSKKE